MITITARLNQQDVQRYKTALTRLVSRAHYHMDRNGGMFNRRCAVEYARQVQENIIRQAFQHLWQPLGLTKGSERYKKWKQKAVGHLNFWRLRGDLLVAIGPERIGAGWLGGVPSWAMDSGGKSWFGRPGTWSGGASKSIAWYGRIMELGSDALGATTVEGGRHPARPVFGPTYDEFAGNTLPSIVLLTMNDIKRTWR